MSELSLAERRNHVVTVTGRRGSGKSVLIAKRIVPTFPRVLTVDWTGEARETYPGAAEVYGLDATIDALQAMHKGNRDLETGAPGEWHLIVVCDPSDVGTLCSMLAPRYDGGKTPALAAVVGGVCLECHEMDVIAPVSGAGSAAQVADAIARGRHARLSFVCAAQRPAQVLRLLTSQSDSIYAFRAHEPRDLQWLRQAGGELLAETARGLKLHHAARYDAATGGVFVLDANGKERTVRARQIELDEPAAED